MLINVEDYRVEIPVIEIPIGNTFVVYGRPRMTSYYMRVAHSAFLLLDSSNRDMLPAVNLKTGQIEFFKKNFRVSPIELEVGVYEHGGKNREDN